MAIQTSDGPAVWKQTQGWPQGSCTFPLFWTCVYRNCYCCNRRSNTQFFGTHNMRLNGLTVIGCDGTNVNTEHKGGIIRLMELASIDHYNGEFVCFKQMSYPSVIY
ncbi:hypothetical protein AVEN_262710-1 [Araneus ventricosus]|uniref:Uncharacterized protein n=1 Tax=Araneus ventricosus TaxID=182803 RepID=A0A4Y2HEU7_ARAVE|nr:hypothetical protein AVEN_262710-1 [Araneus ventricosus]